MKLSLIAPCFNEAENVLPFQQAVMDDFDGCGYDYEIIFVNDGSRDKTFPMAKAIQEKDAHVVLVDFARNFGHQIAVTAGLDQAKGDAVMLGYYNNEEATKATFTRDGWLKTGDMGLMDKDGNIFIKGRCKNMILTGSGQNIYPEEIEDKINNLPYVIESLVVGRKNAIVALVVADYEAAKKDGIDEAALGKLVDENVLALNSELAAYSKIGYVELRSEPFEKTPKQSIRRFMYK